MSKSNSLILFLILFFSAISAQDCDLTLSGQVVDHETDEGLAYVNVYILENGRGTVSDENGDFEISAMCPGEYHVIFSHIGCDPEQKFLKLDSTQSLVVELEHSSKLLEGIVVTGHHVPTSTQNSQIITSQSISDHLDENLANMLEDISGVNTLKNGSGIGKPVIHGLFGNRVTILNNGIAQSGQQWGNDHSPEIDPMVASRIAVIKGVGALEYPGTHLGGVILVEPARLIQEPHLHGSVNYAYTTNGRGSALNAIVGKSSGSWDWRLNGTLRINGDKSTPDYFLTNSGGKEANIAVQVEKAFSEKFSTSVYFSSFNVQLGVLRGSHIGNLTDLENAFTRDVPFFTSDTFSYKINAPKQSVNHQLLKSQTKWFVAENQWLEFNLAVQLNDRKEFDVRRSGRTETPALSLQQWNYYGEAKYNLDVQDRVKIKSGLQVNVTDNTNNPETGILPLIPNYLSYEVGAYGILTRQINRSLLELGLRYDFVYQDAPTITRTFPYEIVRYKNRFNNIGASAGWKYTVSDFIQTSVNVGYTTRNPAINELYSGGLHQGVSGIEEGNPDLNVEQSLKGTLALQLNDEGIYAIDALMYYQRINDYIYLQPSGESRLTIRGAFPVFLYEQTDADIYGFDVSGQVNMTEEWKLKTTYSYIKGLDRMVDQPLIFIPANNFRFSLSYHYKKVLSLLGKKVENIELTLRDQYVFRQNSYNEGQDFVAPPDAYNLVGLDLSSDIQVSKYRLRFFSRVDNLLNVSYRDYLNRQRYFSDDLGISITAGLGLKF